MDNCELLAGSTPLLMSIPHLATELPGQVRSTMSAAGLAVEDTDWELDRLYDFSAELGIGVLTPRYSRYLIDLNRPPDDQPLYAGARNTELVPTTTFAEQPIYLPGREPDDAEIKRRLHSYWEPYHQTLQRELRALRERHGAALLFDCHSIRSRVPRFFEGRLPDFNLGTADDASCAPSLRQALARALSCETYTLATNGRFKGGYITRHYGQPDQGIHAFQLELSQATYTETELPYRFDENKAAAVRPQLRHMLEAALSWVENRDPHVIDRI